jgi:hypothetical protein
MNTNNKILNLLKKSNKLLNYKNIDFNDDEYLLNYYKSLIDQSYLKKESFSSIVLRIYLYILFIIKNNK